MADRLRFEIAVVGTMTDRHLAHHARRVIGLCVPVPRMKRVPSSLCEYKFRGTQWEF